MLKNSTGIATAFPTLAEKTRLQYPDSYRIDAYTAEAG